MESKNVKTKRTTKTTKPTLARSKSVKTRAVAPADVPAAGYTESSSDEDVARLAYALWEERGRPMGSPDEDWFQAKAQLNNQLKEAPRQSA